MCFRLTVLTLFPDMFPGALGGSVIRRAREKGVWELDIRDLRDFVSGGRADRPPFGGGAGMVLRADVIDAALRTLEPPTITGPRFCLSPRGRVFSQALAQQWSMLPGLTLICGRYEGIDQRVLDHHHIEEISLGDFVLTGGELAAQVIADACIRLLPGTMGRAESLCEESFSHGLLEYPHYTRPARWKERSVPEVLRSGNHRDINRWRLKQAQKLTRTRRPDLWQEYCAKHRAQTHWADPQNPSGQTQTGQAQTIEG